MPEETQNEEIIEEDLEAFSDEFTLDPLIELDEDMKDSEFLREAIKNAENGQYSHTMFEAWENVLDMAVESVDKGLSIPVADGLMRQWPWLRYTDLPMYLSYRKSMLQEAKLVLQSCYPKPQELLFEENVGDWEEHKESYLDVIVAWTRLSNTWTSRWDAIPLNKPAKGVMHAVVSDMAALLINPRTGLVENIRNLHGFEVSDEEGEEMIARINEVEDE